MKCNRLKLYNKLPYNIKNHRVKPLGAYPREFWNRANFVSDTLKLVKQPFVQK